MVLLKEVISHEQIRRGGLLRESCTRVPYYLQMGPLKEGPFIPRLGLHEQEKQNFSDFPFLLLRVMLDCLENLKKDKKKRK